MHTQYSYDANDRLLGAGGVSYAYDNAGNLLSETQDGQTKTYTWDAKHKLARASTPQALVDYLYDVDGIRSAKLVNGQRTDYVVDHNTAYAQVLLEADPSGTAAYTRGLALLGQERDGASSYYHADALGSTKQLTDATGTTTDRYAYTAFGKAQSATGSTANSYRYTGEQFDDSLGQYYLRARNYDPATGRFTQRDPFAGVGSSPVTLHDYMYGGNDPVMNTDPGGQFFSAGGGMVSASINVSLRGMNIYGTAHSAAGFLRSLAAGDTEEAAEAAAYSLMSRFGVAFFARYAKTFGARLMKNQKLKAIADCFDNSFTGDTLIKTNRGLIPIKDVKIGDLVTSFDEKTGAFSEQRVIHLIQRQKAEDFVILSLDSGEIVEVTAEHPFYVAGQWVDAKDLRAGDVLTTQTDRQVRVKSVRTERRSEVAFNLEIENTHTYTISADGVVVHNAKKTCRLDDIQALPRPLRDLAKKCQFDPSFSPKQKNVLGYQCVGGSRGAMEAFKRLANFGEMIAVPSAKGGNNFGGFGRGLLVIDGVRVNLHPSAIDKGPRDIVGPLTIGFEFGGVEIKLRFKD